MSKPQEKVKIRWSSDFAYAIGLITTDGNLSRDERHISIKSSEKEMVLNFKKALDLKNKITESARGGEKQKRYLNVFFGDVVFYRFLKKIGLKPAKSRTIKSVEVPDKYFSDFLRGVFDGDGTFYTFWDKRWSRAFGYQISFASASKDFITWLKGKLYALYQVKGFICNGKRVYNLRYVKGDSRTLYEKMYQKKNILYLKRKRFKIEKAFKQEFYIKKPR